MCPKRSSDTVQRHYVTRGSAISEVRQVTFMRFERDPDRVAGAAGLRHTPRLAPRWTATMYIWIKALHVAFMVTWFAGLFYLPRLFIYHAMADDAPGLERFEIMEKRLFGIMTIGAVLTLVFGLVMLALNPGLLQLLWFQIKLLLLAGLSVYHYRCLTWMRRLKAGYRPDGTTWLRWFNEIPVIFLLGIILLAVAKPF